MAGLKYNSADDFILDLFGDEVARVYLRDDLHPDDRDKADGIKERFSS